MTGLQYVLIFFSFCAAALAWTFLYEPNSFELQTWQVSFFHKLKRKYRILHLTDIHFAAPRKSLSRFFDRLAREQWDFIFVTGDIFDCEAGADTGTAELKKLKAKFGKFAVFGNHDHFDYQLQDVVHALGRHPEKRNNVGLFEKALSKADVQLLRNKTVSVKTEDPILIHGLDDPVTEHADYAGLQANLDPKKTNILLTHTIDAFFHIPENAVQLSFSGHSHGGQVRIPGWGAFITHTRLGRAYAQGLHQFKGAFCVVSRGMGTSRFFAFRLFCRPQAISVEVF